MALPDSRDENFAAGSLVPSATINNLQDHCIRHEQLLQNLHEGLLQGLVWELMARPAAAAVVRPAGRALGIYGQAAGAGPTLKFRGGLVVSNNGPVTMPRLDYLAADDEINIALGAGPGVGQYRRDIVCVRLVHTAPYMVTLERQVVAGTPNVVEASAVDAATPAGWTKIASVLLTGTGAITADTAKVRDFRVPLGLRRIRIPAKRAFHYLSTHYGAHASVAAALISDSTAGRLAYAFPVEGLAFDGRLMKVGLAARFPVGPVTSAIVRLVSYSIGGSVANLEDLSASLVATGGAIAYREADLSATPWWCTGFQAPLLNESNPLGSAGPSNLALQVSSSDLDDELAEVFFDVAGTFASEI